MNNENKVCKLVFSFLSITSRFLISANMENDPSTEIGAYLPLKNTTKVERAYTYRHVKLSVPKIALFSI